MGGHLNLNRLIFFTAVIEAGSFTAAADRLGVAKAVVSHQIARLEEELGVTLLTRTTRRLHATEEGSLFYERCVLILRQAESAYGEMSLRSAEPSGTLTLTAPLDYGAAVVAPTIAGYLQAYPQMHVDAIFDDSVNDLVAERIDLSIRVGWLSDSSHQARRLGTFEQVLAATPSVAARIPADLAAADAASLPWIANGALKNALRWTFSRGQREAVTIETRSIVTTDKTPAAYACVLAGIGVSVFPDYMVAADMRAGKIVRLFPEWALPQGGIHAVFPPARFRPAKVRAFLDMLVIAERRRIRETSVISTLDPMAP
ncbi:LysR family transcriptional regulator [Rhizobium sullae]|uniref:LysR family transcriptional regulator n=1 Tax=Rhizobium sullae TaxID=50338 RepID=UPI000B35D633|nr:LysR family transcriptional regulator [Rhizobium sullae]